MFATRIRTSALAFAGAALLSTSLLAPFTAAAAPISQPLSEAQAGIKLARADIQVRPMGRTGVSSDVTYKFNIKNAGPDKMTFHIDSRATFRKPGDHQVFSDDFSAQMTRENGETKAFDVVCNSAHNCYSGFREA